jgi:hypothetical protein
VGQDFASGVHIVSDKNHLPQNTLIKTGFFVNSKTGTILAQLQNKFPLRLEFHNVWNQQRTTEKRRSSSDRLFGWN